MSDREAARASEHIPIPDEHYAAMGKVADSWADLEFEIDQLIWEFLQTAQALGACVTAQMISVHPRMNALIALAKLWEISAAHLDDLGRFYGKIGPLADKRNRLIHDKRFIELTKKQVVRFEVSAKSRSKFEPVPETIGSLTNFAREVTAMQLEFLLIKQRVLTELSASQDKPRAPLPSITRATDQKPIHPTDEG
jgi:hypothetical protein